MLGVFSLCPPLPILCVLAQYQGFKYHPNADNSQIYVSTPDLFPELQTRITNCLLRIALECLIDISNVTCQKLSSRALLHPSLLPSLSQLLTFRCSAQSSESSNSLVNQNPVIPQASANLWTTAGTSQKLSWLLLSSHSLSSTWKQSFPLECASYCVTPLFQVCVLMAFRSLRERGQSEPAALRADGGCYSGHTQTGLLTLSPSSLCASTLPPAPPLLSCLGTSVWAGPSAW